MGGREPVNTVPAVEKGLAFAVNTLCHCKWKMSHGKKETPINKESLG